MGGRLCSGCRIGICSVRRIVQVYLAHLGGIADVRDCEFSNITSGRYGAASSIGRRNTYYKLIMWSDNYEEEICAGWVYAGSED